MAKKFLTSIDMNKNEIQNAVMQPLATAPSNPKVGQYYYNSSDKKMYQWNGSAWVSNTYTHPTSDGNKHVPATGTSNSGKVLKAGSTAGSMSWSALSKSDVGLGNVDNTSDMNKPVSTAQQQAIQDAAENMQMYVQDEINKIVGEGAAETLDTIGEISAALQGNKDIITTLNQAVGNKANSSDLTSHTSNTSNPHSVTKSQVGLGNVPNVATNDQTPTYTASTSLTDLTSGEKLSVAMGKIKRAISDLISHLANKSNPHAVTKSQVGLGNVENKSSATIRGEITSANVTTALGFTPVSSEHSHNYAGSSSAGGSADSAVKLTSSDGSLTQPVFFRNGVPQAIAYTIEKSVPSNAKFTDTTYSEATTTKDGLMSAADKIRLINIGELAVTIVAGYTNSEVAQGRVVAYCAYDETTGEEVIVDYTYNSTANTTVFSINEAYANNILIYYIEGSGVAG